MGSLLKQNWFVARKNFLFWLILAVLFFGSGWAALSFYSELGMVPGLGIVYAFFAAVFIGDAGSSGRLQNEIVAGFSRTAVWFSCFLTLLFCFVLMAAAAMLGDLAGTAFAGRIEVYDPQLLGLIFLSLCLNAAGFAGMFTLICLLITGRRSGRGTVMLIVCCSVFIAIGIWGGNIENALWEPEMITSYDMSEVGIDADMIDVFYEDGENPSGLVTRQVPNPAYVGEPLRSQYEAIEDFLPVTQAIRMLQVLRSGDGPMSPEAWHALYILWLDAAILTACTAGACVVLFRRRDLT